MSGLGQVIVAEKAIALAANVGRAEFRFPGLKRGWAYVSVLDPADDVAESDEHSNTRAWDVPGTQHVYTQWPEHSR